MEFRYYVIIEWPLKKCMRIHNIEVCFSVWRIKKSRKLKIVHTPII